ncbi:hypothetical protein C7S16_4866 [Burkholderia thailandensis]|uniref:Uncharacterized protein n=1 Tax=Burkholderia thailandensis TaxID=57975 RepID=A0AAW9CUW1_BURTH|nr:hypothetical protein [Burkholderia thailandensis]MDW9253701.1 hypothetical protein [Burkholderia thailandensis]
MGRDQHAQAKRRTPPPSPETPNRRGHAPRSLRSRHLVLHESPRI